MTEVSSWKPVGGNSWPAGDIKGKCGHNIIPCHTEANTNLIESDC